MYEYAEDGFWVQAPVIIGNNIQLQAPNRENPGANARVSKISVVVRGGVDQSHRKFNPSGHQLVNLVMIPNIDWNDFILSNDEFKRNPEFEVDRDAVQAV